MYLRNLSQEIVMCDAVRVIFICEQRKLSLDSRGKMSPSELTIKLLTWLISCFEDYWQLFFDSLTPINGLVILTIKLLTQLE